MMMKRRVFFRLKAGNEEDEQRRKMFPEFQNVRSAVRTNQQLVGGPQ